MSRKSNPRSRANLLPHTAKVSFQSGRPVVGSGLNGMAARVAAAAVQEMAFRRSYAYMTQVEAPFITIDAVDTDFELACDLGGFRFEIPWMLQEGFDTIEVSGLFNVPLSARNHVAVRFSAQTLITAITDVFSPYVALGGREAAHAGPPSPGVWTTGDLAVTLPTDTLVRFDATIIPERPADNLVALVFEARSDPQAADPGGDVEIVVRLHSIFVRNAITDLED